MRAERQTDRQTHIHTRWLQYCTHLVGRNNCRNDFVLLGNRQTSWWSGLSCRWSRDYGFLAPRRFGSSRSLSVSIDGASFLSASAKAIIRQWTLHADGSLGHTWDLNEIPGLLSASHKCTSGRSLLRRHINTTEMHLARDNMVIN